jgi:hypothetical protein
MKLTEPKLKNLGLEAQKKLTSRIMDIQLKLTAMIIAGTMLVDTLSGARWRWPLLGLAERELTKVASQSSHATTGVCTITISKKADQKSKN